MSESAYSNNDRGAGEDEDVYFCYECVLPTNSVFFLSLRAHDSEGMSQKDELSGRAFEIGMKGCVSNPLVHSKLSHMYIFISLPLEV